MPRHPLIAYLKIGWLENYQGEKGVKGRAGYLQEYGDGSERWIFHPGPGRRLYGYVPPIGDHRPPQAQPQDGWSVIFVAPMNGSGRLVPVGYYLQARFESAYKNRPEYDTDPGFESAPDGGKHPFAVSTHVRDSGFIPVTRRLEFPIPGERLRRASILYARRPGYKDAWRLKYAAIAEEILREFSQATPTAGPPPSLGGGFGDPETNKKVELAGISATKRYLRQHGYRNIEEVWKTKHLGYDLRAWRPSRPKDELLVEVKGTAAITPAFIITTGEYMSRLDPRWRFAMVTSALSRPRVSLMRRRRFERAFELTPLMYRGTPRS